jgi:transcriptional regulator with XRE-family HTH domain
MTVSTQQLKKLRVMAGFRTQQELAEHLGVGVSTISNYERGAIIPDFTYEYFLKAEAKKQANKLTFC